MKSMKNNPVLFANIEMDDFWKLMLGICFPQGDKLTWVRLHSVSFIWYSHDPRLWQ